MRWVLAAGMALVTSVALAGEGLCGIETQASGAMLSVRGVVRGAAEAGRYRFDVTKIGPAGRSTIRQAGEVAPAQGAAQAGQVTLSLEEGARFEAVLTLTVGGHTHICRAGTDH